jgi:hypothetical protein
MIYKLESIHYQKDHRKLIFKFHTPVKKNFCGAKSYILSLKYESAKKAQRLIEEMKKFQGRYQIKIEDVK